MLLLDKLTIAKILSPKLGLEYDRLKVDDFTRCEFHVTSPGGGGPPIVTIQGGGSKPSGGQITARGRNFTFSIRGILWSDNDGVHCECHTTEVYWDDREELKTKVIDLLESHELDEYVHDLKGEEAAAINNGGIEEQFEYLADEAGLAWIKDTLLKDNDDDDDE